MQDCVNNHQNAGDLESYSLERLVPALMDTLEPHLLACQLCRTKLVDIEPYNFIHFVGDGPVYTRITKLRTAKYLARYWSRSLEGGREFKTQAGAKAYLVDTFAEMFPQHCCTARCGPADCGQDA